MKLELKPTTRGFLRADFLDQYGKACSIQESSLATGACIWLGMDKGLHLKGDSSQEWTKEELEQMQVNCLGRMHLTQEMALELGKQLLYFAKKGKLKEEKKEVKHMLKFFTGEPNGNFYLGICTRKEIEQVKKEFENKYKNIIIEVLEKDIFRVRDFYGTQMKLNLHYKTKSMSYLVKMKTANKKPRYWDIYHYDQVLEWLKAGQQGFYTPTGLVKELP